MEQTKETMQRNIMRQLLNPTISLDTCKRVLQTLSTKTDDQMSQLLTQLNRNHATFLEQVKLTADPSEYEQLCEQMRERIVQCGEWYDIQLKDVLHFTEGCRFNLLDVAWDLVTPTSLTDIVNEYVRGQQEYVSAMALMLYNFTLGAKNNSLLLPKTNLLAFGPTGVGKTYCPQVFSRLLNFELEIVNCNIIVQEGIIGMNLLDALTNAHIRNPKFTHIVIVLDEYDKVFFQNGHYNERIQHEIQTLSDDNNMVTYRVSFDSHASQRQIPSKNIAIVYTGVFAGLKEIVERRLNIHKIGFDNQRLDDNEKDCFYNKVCREDFANYMNSKELAGRVGQAVPVRPMSEELLLDILLNAAESPLGQFQNYFAMHGTRLTLTDEAAQAVVSTVQKLQLGVRGLKTMLWEILQGPMQGIGKRVAATQQPLDELRIDRPQVEQIITKDF